MSNAKWSDPWITDGLVVGSCRRGGLEVDGAEVAEGGVASFDVARPQPDALHTAGTDGERRVRAVAAANGPTLLGPLGDQRPAVGDVDIKRTVSPAEHVAQATREQSSIPGRLTSLGSSGFLSAIRAIIP
jgi:hypothetical protein